MDTTARVEVYQRRGRIMTPAQRRRLIKKAGRDPYALVQRDEGMGYPASMVGYKELVGFRRPEPGEDVPF